ncbi:hypothetical protein niasHS_007093 [Heterodera schachtii]|uniref:Uncharacterized protein n=1 Tax=Heterodera schachtii TaxID=97005 RepID=A0ABD2JFJ6_HETSC
MLKVIRSDQNNSNNPSQSHKSFAVIMAVTFCLWFLFAPITNILARGLITSDPSLQFLSIRLVAQLTTIAGAINAPVLYFCSSEYREIMKNEFPWVKFLLCSNNHNSPVVVVAAGQQILGSPNIQANAS